MAPTTKRNTTDEYHGPSPREMLANHTMAQEIIARHNDPCPIFDDRSILLLREFATNPAKAQSIADRVRAQQTQSEQDGDLAIYLIAKHNTDQPALADDEVRALKEWFDNGGGRTDAELAAAADAA